MEGLPADRIRGGYAAKEWYRHVDPMSQVDPALVAFVAGRAGQREWRCSSCSLRP